MDTAGSEEPQITEKPAVYPLYAVIGTKLFLHSRSVFIDLRCNLSQYSVYFHVLFSQIFPDTIKNVSNCGKYCLKVVLN